MDRQGLRSATRPSAYPDDLMHHAVGRVLVTGATGYVGGRLLRKLEESGRTVRCMVRRPEALSGRTQEQTEIVHGDVLDPASLQEALAGVTVAYYLVHSMAGSEPFAGADRRGAENFAAAARKSGVRRIVYLGGLGADQHLSTHLESRHEVGRILRGSGVPTIEFRASIVIGSGSVSFEIVRSLVDRSPLLLMPRWVVSRTQPIGIEDVLAYLLAALNVELEESRLFEIGGPDRVAYADLMREYARQVGLRRAVIRVPFATPRISGLWLSLVTPVYATIGRGLIESLRNDTLVDDGSARSVFPIRPRGFSQAIARALANEDRDFAETRWSDALSASPRQNWGGVIFGQRAVASRTVRVAASPEQTFAPLQRIGGKTGWYYANTFWRLRGLLDNVVGGVGLRRGRRDPVRLSVGDTLDFWRVEAYEQDRLLRLSSEMKSPGRIWLQFEVDGNPTETTLRQTAIFDPHGLAGLVYWYTLYPVHYLIFAGMLRRIRQVAITSGTPKAAPTPGRTAMNLAVVPVCIHDPINALKESLMTATYTFDVFSSLDGFGSASGGDWGGYWGKQGPELLDHRLALYSEAQRMVFGANTYRLFAQMLASSTEESEVRDPWVTRMVAQPAIIVSNTLEAPLDWPDGTVVSGDAVDVVARLKDESDVPLRSHGSLSMNRGLMAAGLVDRVQVTLFPVITGQNGSDAIFEGAADFDLELIESRTLDGDIQELTYRPALHVSV